jgi:hypothetical protein
MSFLLSKYTIKKIMEFVLVEIGKVSDKGFVAVEIVSGNLGQYNHDITVEVGKYNKLTQQRDELSKNGDRKVFRTIADVRKWLSYDWGY